MSSTPPPPQLPFDPPLGEVARRVVRNPIRSVMNRIKQRAAEGKGCISLAGGRPLSSAFPALMNYGPALATGAPALRTGAQMRTAAPPPGDGDGMLPAELRATAVVYLVPTAQNPTGVTMPDARRSADDPYAHLLLGGEGAAGEGDMPGLKPGAGPRSFLASRVLLAPGFRLGWLTGRRALVDRLSAMAEVMVWALSGFTQDAMLRTWAYRVRRDRCARAFAARLRGAAAWRAPPAGIAFAAMRATVAKSLLSAAPLLCAATAPPPRGAPSCVNEATFNAGYGLCDTYAPGGSNNGFCDQDMDQGIRADAACPGFVKNFCPRSCCVHVTADFTQCWDAAGTIGAGNAAWHGTREEARQRCMVVGTDCAVLVDWACDSQHGGSGWRYCKSQPSTGTTNDCERQV
eukprot:gene35082-47175_t